jgi:hypothetical protein
MTEYREHWHKTPSGPSAVSTQTQSGHVHSFLVSEQQGDFATHIHKTGCGPTGAPIFQTSKQQENQNDNN